MSDKQLLTFDTYVGQKEIIKRVKVVIQAALSNNKPLPHMLFLGGGGLGKTALAETIAREINRPIITSMGENLKKDTDILDLMVMLFDQDEIDPNTHQFPILFLDEIHGLTNKMQEAFYRAMEDLIYYSTKKVENKPLTVNLHPFTLIGATTNVEKLKKPLLSRFILQFEFKPYSINESKEMAANYMQATFENGGGYALEEVAYEVALRSKGIGRIVINNCKILKDYLIANPELPFNKVTANKCFNLFGIDSSGLQDIDYRLLNRLYQYSPEAIGGKHLAALMNYEISYIEEYLEPWLIEIGAIARTKTGRIITNKGIKLLKQKHNDNESKSGIDVMDLVRK